MENLLLLRTVFGTGDIEMHSMQSLSPKYSEINGEERHSLTEV